MSNISVSVIVPLFNEEKVIAGFVKELLSLKKANWEIIIVDDGSTDKSAELVLENDITLLRHQANRGYGAAIKTGIAKAKNDVIAIVDADGTYPLSELPHLLEFIGGFDMVVAERKSGVSVARIPAKWVLKKLAEYLSGSKIPDLNSGFRVFKKSIAERFLRILPDGFSFTTTITLAMLTNGYSVKYVPINYQKRIGKSKIHPINDTLAFLQLIIRTVLYFNPLKIFIPMSLMLFCASILVLLLSRFLLGYVMDVTVVMLFISGIQVLAIGMIADLIDKRI
ncbi:MAG: glycosyltransferase family 2 protein [Candidatus Omnitrophota bacterium]|nr:glycosyltransferase family 2 protein [Candidatus Omnitrophota bacterium]